MKSIYVIAAGFAVNVAGIFVLAGGAPGGESFGWLMVAIGIIVIVAGFVLAASTFMRPDRTENTGDGALEIRLLIQAMAAMAAADGRIESAEIAEFAAIYSRITGLGMESERIESILLDIGRNFDIATRLRQQRPNLSPQFRMLIVKSCHQVMLSDAIADSAEIDKFHEIAGALGYDAQQAEGIAAT